MLGVFQRCLNHISNQRNACHSNKGDCCVMDWQGRAVEYRQGLGGGCVHSGCGVGQPPAAVLALCMHIEVLATSSFPVALGAHGPKHPRTVRPRTVPEECPC